MTDALMVLDMQTDLLAVDGRFPVAEEQVAGLLRSTNAAIAASHDRGAAVVYIRTAFRPWDPGNLFRRGCCVRGRPGSELDPRVRAEPGAAHFEKWRGDAFCNDELGAWLKREGVDTVVVCGVYADACVRATVRGALRRGLRVTVLSDAVAASSHAAREAALDQMRRAGATIMTVGSWLGDEGVSA